MTDQPEALRLAHDLKDYWEGMESHHVAALHRCAVVMLREQHAEIERLRADAERYRELASRAHKVITYDRYGNSTHWAIRFFVDDDRRTLAAAIDAAMREGKP